MVAWWLLTDAGQHLTSSLAGLLVAATPIFATVLAFVLLFRLVAEVGPARATVITYVNPAVALAAGVVFLSEPVTTGMLVGFPLVLLGAFLATRRARRVQLDRVAVRAG
jgi:drug/metabolite transporter (DMT)-like permease